MIILNVLEKWKMFQTTHQNNKDLGWRLSYQELASYSPHSSNSPIAYIMYIRCIMSCCWPTVICSIKIQSNTTTHHTVGSILSPPLNPIGSIYAGWGQHFHIRYPLVICHTEYGPILDELAIEFAPKTIAILKSQDGKQHGKWPIYRWFSHQNLHL